MVTDAQQQKRRRPAPALPLSGTLLLLGCASAVTATRIHPAPRPLVARDPGSVQVLAGEPPDEPHVEVALLQMDPYEAYSPHGMAALIQRLREKAAEIGCDAVYLKDTTAPLASCVVFTPPDATREVEAELANTQSCGASTSMKRESSVPKTPFAPPLGPAVK